MNNFHDANMRIHAIRTPSHYVCNQVNRSIQALTNIIVLFECAKRRMVSIAAVAGRSDVTKYGWPLGLRGSRSIVLSADSFVMSGFAAVPVMCTTVKNGSLIASCVSASSGTILM